ncbi:Protein CBG22858 [Caenorhabditis briggsae]|uniref:Protein CBG22858 n=1 Tax=Caenorhabditis briggsae TaxID=6238 RepID=A8Y382_CAEBR|nr:Protein CBG22858 [Caenorhabditis briggsae]CAP39351.1 Protein CBG22858 [Caenorhabditis briggsae]
MFKSFILIAFVASALFAAPVPEKAPEESRAELLSYGISPEAADGLIRIETKTEQSGVRPNNSAGSPLEAINGFFKYYQDVESFMKTQSPEDQEGVKRILKKKKAELDAKNGGKLTIFEFFVLKFEFE